MIRILVAFAALFSPMTVTLITAVVFGAALATEGHSPTPLYWLVGPVFFLPVGLAIENLVRKRTRKAFAVVYLVTFAAGAAVRIIFQSNVPDGWSLASEIAEVVTLILLCGENILRGIEHIRMRRTQKA